MGLKFNDISPLAGIISGKGFMGDITKSGVMGIAPMLISRNAAEKDKEKQERMRQEREAEEAQAMQDAQAKKGMKKGGKVSTASSRADGIAQRGKTRGKVC